MKKVFFSMVLAFMTLMNVNAQYVQLATLQTADGTQVFYGADAFKKTMEAANHGDVITLSAGSFNAADINKAVSIYGAGYEMDEKMKNQVTLEDTDKLPKYPTRIVGDFSIKLDSIDQQPARGLYLEGLYSDDIITVEDHLQTASFVKCRFGRFQFGERNLATSNDCLFIQCKIAGWLAPGEYCERLSIDNSIVNNLWHTGEKSVMNVRNSVLINISSIIVATFENCIIRRICLIGNYCEWWYGNPNGYQQRLNPLSSSYHCMYGNPDAIVNLATKENNWSDANYANILFGIDQENEYSDIYLYKLTDESKMNYLGTDGKEIGIYGGISPFSTILTTPCVVKKDIATKTTDGKLKVNIKVETGDNSL